MELKYFLEDFCEKLRRDFGSYPVAIELPERLFNRLCYEFQDYKTPPDQIHTIHLGQSETKVTKG